MLRVERVEELPTPTQDRERILAVVKGGAGESTTLYICAKNAADTYEWVDLSTPGTGADGLSAYEVAVADGFVGDEAAWLASLVGATGTTGSTGPTGPTGPAGTTDHTLLSNIGTNTHDQIDTHLASTSNPHSVTKTQVGLANVDNVQQQPIDADLTTIAGLTATTDNVIQSVAGSWASRTMAQLKAALALVKGDVGLGNVDNVQQQPIDTDLTTIAGLTATTDNVIQSVASAWASRTPAQLKTSLALVKGDVGLGNVENVANVVTSLLIPPGFYVANLTTVTAFPSGTCGIQYIGKAPKPMTSCELLCRVATAAVTITWAEVAIFKGAHPGRAGGSLTPCGFTNVAATYNSLGQKATTIALSGVSAGDDLWLCWGSSATTPFQLRGMLADDIQSGAFQSFAVRPSLAASPQATSLVNAVTAPAWIVVRVT